MASTTQAEKHRRFTICPSCNARHNGGRNVCDGCRASRFPIDAYRIEGAGDFVVVRVRLPDVNGRPRWRVLFECKVRDLRGTFFREEELRDAWRNAAEDERIEDAKRSQYAQSSGIARAPVDE